MKNQKLPTASKFSIVRQLCNHIPNHLVPKLARETGVDEQARTKWRLDNGTHFMG
jgi:hypothetical protein